MCQKLAIKSKTATNVNGNSSIPDALPIPTPVANISFKAICFYALIFNPNILDTDVFGVMNRFMQVQIKFLIQNKTFKKCF